MRWYWCPGSHGLRNLLFGSCLGPFLCIQLCIAVVIIVSWWDWWENESDHFLAYAFLWVSCFLLDSIFWFRCIFKTDAQTQSLVSNCNISRYACRIVMITYYFCMLLQHTYYGTCSDEIQYWQSSTSCKIQYLLLQYSLE